MRLLRRSAPYGAELLAMTLIWTVTIFAEVYITKEEAIKNIFPGFQKYRETTKIVDSQEVKVYTVLSDDKVMGWAVVLDEMGKVKPITFLVGIDGQGRVLEVYVLEYRDMFGSDIKRKGFLKQFRNKTIKDMLKVGRDIDAVTGATISSNAAASAVRKTLTVVEEFR